MALGGRREAWDSPVFWTIGLPALLLMNAIAGFIEPDRIILKGISSVCLQPVAMMVKSGEVGSMFLPGLMLVLVQGLFFSIGGGAGALIKNKFFIPGPLPPAGS
ncbi:MAG: hypothetical protein A2234_08720 [Elusimicrobia bacterium RIFOXYA2_FULL_58_8]|nr:MAG: hypothetical protein A2285_05040 [Elusimicrobia bacterium RIFOXYA12_FULL_57_11]OGS16916.1 MAG: hypothetical protein A2234_08720 [Elusimicrobia bacterium RIFOXYA2_FULL_58_8]